MRSTFYVYSMAAKSTPEYPDQCREPFICTQPQVQECQLSLYGELLPITTSVDLQRIGVKERIRLIQKHTASCHTRPARQLRKSGPHACQWGHLHQCRGRMAQTAHPPFLHGCGVFALTLPLKRRGAEGKRTDGCAVQSNARFTRLSHKCLIPLVCPQPKGSL